MNKSTARARAMAGAAGLLVLLVTACSGGAANQAGKDADGPIRIAVVTPQSGPYASYGEEQRKGIQFAAAQANAAGGVDGHEVKLVFGDSLGTPEGAIAASQKLVQQKGARYIIGLVSTPEMAAVTPKLEAWDALMIGSQGQGDDLTGSACTSRYFRVTANDTVGVNTIATWIQKEDVDNWDSIAADYSFGQASTEGVRDAVAAKGGRLHEALLTPLGTTDFGTYLSQLTGKGGLVVSLAGSDAVNFYKQALSFGILQKYDVVVANTGLQSTTLAALDDDRLVGVRGTNSWLPTADNSGTQEFVSAYREKHGEGPTENIGNGYLGMQALFAGIEAAGSAAPGDVAEAMEGLTFDSIQGQVTLRAEDHQIEAPSYVGTVRRDDGRLILAAEQAISPADNNPAPNPACKL